MDAQRIGELLIGIAGQYFIVHRGKDEYSKREIIKDGCKGGRRSRVGEFSISILEPCISDPDVVSRVINYDVRPRRRACCVSRNYSTVSAGLPVKNTKGGMIYNRSCFLCIECLPHRARAARRNEKRADVSAPKRRPWYSISDTRSETREYRGTISFVVTNCSPGVSVDWIFFEACWNTFRVYAFLHGFFF